MNAETPWAAHVAKPGARTPRRRKIVDLVVEVLAHAPDATGVGVDGFGLQALELEVLQVGAVRAGKWLGKSARVEPAGVGEHGENSR